MNPLITAKDLLQINLDSKLLIMCHPPESAPSYYLPKSYLVSTFASHDQFVNELCLSKFPKNSVIVYDEGSLREASKVYWGLVAMGFSDVKVLAAFFEDLEDCGIEVEEGMPSGLPKADTFAEFDSDLFQNKNHFMNFDIKGKQIIYAKTIDLKMLVPEGLKSHEEVIEELEFDGIEFQRDKETIVHGEDACKCALILKYLGLEKVSVVVENLFSRANPAPSRSFVTNGSLFHSFAETEYFDPEEDKSSMNSRVSRHYSVSASTKRSKKDFEAHANNSCECSIL